MSVKRTKFEKDVIYYFTVTCYKWLPLFEITNFYTEIYKWFDILKTKGFKIVAYVIMPNHFHAMIYVPKKEKLINNVIGSGKRFMAYEIVKRLSKLKKENVLKILREGVNKLEKSRGKLHQVFEQSFNLKEVVTERFLKQKINYIHQNPVSKKWKLVKDYRDYQHSSAGFYEGSKYKGYLVTHFTDI